MLLTVRIITEKAFVRLNEGQYKDRANMIIEVPIKMDGQ